MILEAEGMVSDAAASVVVVGAGATGCTAALAASEAGADVILLEADARPAGSTAMSIGGVCAAATAEHRRHGIDDSPQAFFDDVMAKSEGRADPALARLIAHESGPALDWLAQAHDVPLELDFAWTSLGHSRPRLHMPPGRTGVELLERLTAAAHRAGALTLASARVSGLYADARRRVRGVRIDRPDGSHETLGCEALVLATCGFGAHEAMRRELIPEMAGARYFGHEGNKGDALRWGSALGGTLADLSGYQGLGTLAEPQGIIVPHPLLGEGGLLVNASGARFTHEMANISAMCVPVLAQPGGIAWVVFDEARHRRALGYSPDQVALTELGALRSADTLEDLAGRCGMDPGVLVQEVRAMAAAREQALPDRFGRVHTGTAPLAPPFHAIRVTGALFHTLGGLTVNAQAQVTGPQEVPLPNLFAGGGAARGISGPGASGYLPGAGLCMAITLGRLAGRAAARLSLAASSQAPSSSPRAFSG